MFGSNSSPLLVDGLLTRDLFLEPAKTLRPLSVLYIPSKYTPTDQSVIISAAIWKKSSNGSKLKESQTASQRDSGY